jgi:hypothetical protein
MATPVHLNIPEPCHENWQQMTPNEQGRHCMSCQKTVVDFTLMSDQEVLDYISRASSSVCGRFNNHQLDKTYEEKKTKRSFSFRYAWNVVVATFLLTGTPATAQTKKTQQKKAPVERKGKLKLKDLPVTLGQLPSIKPDPVPELKSVTLGFTVITSADHSLTNQNRYTLPALKIFGYIRDSATKKPVGFASVRVKGVERGIPADENGRYELPMVDMGGNVTLVVSAIGYATREYIVPANNFQASEILLTAAPDELSPVVIIAGPVMGKIVRVNPEIKKDNSTCTVTIGGVTTGVKITKLEKIKRDINDWLPTKKDVRVYPNPVMPGNQVNISLNLNKTGEYKLELMDAAGKLVYGQALQVAEKIQIAQVPTQSTWSRGVYWMRISKAGEKKVYQAKVVLQ